MDTISSAEFRKRYAKLTQPTRVTVLGYPIGEWHPIGNRSVVMAEEERAFNSRPFTPVPKRTKR